MLTQDQLKTALSYDPVTGEFQWRNPHPCSTKKVGDTAGTIGSEGYRIIRLNGGFYKAHRLAWLYVHGAWPPNQVDHINRDKGDNRIANLRLATNQQNQVYKTFAAKPLPRGVRRMKDRYQARFGENGKVHLGTFKTVAEAKAVYDAYVKETFGEFYAGQ